MTPDQYCRERLAASGSSFAHSFRFLDRERRQAITALYAFCREVDDVVDECTEPAIAAIKLAWWRQEIVALYGGQPNHPVSRALAKAIAKFALPQEHLQEIIDGMEMDLRQTRYADFKDLHLYCYRVASVVGLLSAEIFGYHQHHPRRRRGRAPRSHLSAAGRIGALWRQRARYSAQPNQRTISGADDLPGPARRRPL